MSERLVISPCAGIFEPPPSAGAPGLAAAEAPALGAAARISGRGILLSRSVTCWVPCRAPKCGAPLPAN